MAMVYRYDFYDRALQRERRSSDYATAEAIEGLGGTILPETAREVDEGLVDDWGVLHVEDLAKSEPAPEPSAPHEPRIAGEANEAERDVVRDEIDLADPDQVRDWVRSLGVSREALEDAVRAVGRRFSSVREYLGNIRS